MAQMPTGPHPTTTAVYSFLSLSLRFFKNREAAKYPAYAQSSSPPGGSAHTPPDRHRSHYPAHYSQTTHSSHSGTTGRGHTRHRIPLLHHLTDEFVPADEVRRTLDVAAVEVQVAAAQRGGGDFEDGVGGVLEFGDRTVFHGDFVFFLEHDGSHRGGGHGGGVGRTVFSFDQVKLDALLDDYHSLFLSSYCLCHSLCSRLPKPILPR
ncbi:hypothetical protein KC334_g46 [Hortaea werneckii]|nr:hypothetical protein KC334_g46 [Hortaea werneckii]